MSRYKAYSEYVPSEVEFLDSLPVGWRALRGKYVFSEYSERSEYGEEQLLSVSEYYGVKPRGEVVEEGDFLSRAESLVGYKKCQKNDLVMNIMLAWKCGLGVSKYDGIVSPAYSVFRFNGNAVPDYMHYLLRTETYTGHFKTRSTGVIDSRLRLYPESLCNVSIILPPAGEQKKIATFLDHETAKIDALIEKQQRLIELLKEKRQAVISHAVTKGLNPNAPMKDSGVEWLGEVPAHWIVAKLSFRYEVLLGKMLDDKKITGNFLGSYLRNTDVQWARINTEDLPQMDFYPSEQDRYSVKKLDLIVCEGGEIGRCAIWENDEPCFYQKALHRLRPLNANCDMTRFMFYHLFNAVHQERFISGAGKSTIAHLPAETFRQFRFAYPPLSEQVEISSFLDELKLKFDALETKALSQISFLQERRTALISAAVTGKIDVRDWQAAA